MAKYRRLVIRYWTSSRVLTTSNRLPKSKHRQALLYRQAYRKSIWSLFSHFTELLIVYWLNKENVKVSQWHSQPSLGHTKRWRTREGERWRTDALDSSRIPASIIWAPPEIEAGSYAHLRPNLYLRIEKGIQSGLWLVKIAIGSDRKNQHRDQIVFLSDDCWRYSDIAILDVIDQTRVECLIRGSKHEKTNENQGRSPRFLLFSSVWSPLMKHEKRVFDLASQTSIPIAICGVFIALMNAKQ